MTESRLHFRSLARSDFALLAQWLAAPHVQVWWREDSDASAIERRYGPAVDRTDQTEVFIVERDGDPIGFIQRYLLEDNSEWQRSLAPSGVPNNGAGIDYLIGRETMIGQGLGPAIIDRFVEDTWVRYPEIAAIVANVSPENVRSWRALEKSGFDRVWSGVLESDDPSDAGPSHVYVRHRSRVPGDLQRGRDGDD